MKMHRRTRVHLTKLTAWMSDTLHNQVQQPYARGCGELCFLDERLLRQPWPASDRYQPEDWRKKKTDKVFMTS